MIWGERFDFLSIGSGAAGLMGAAVAAERGAKVAILESTRLLGGTTGFSGALLWAPCNRLQRAAGIEDDIDTARRYVERCIGAERAADPRWAVFLDTINDVLDWLESRTALRFELTRYPDAYGEWPEGRSSRHVSSRPVPLQPLGPWQYRLRRPTVPGFDLLTMRDLERMHAWMGPPTKLAALQLGPRLAWRKLRGKAGMGTGLVASLLGVALRHGAAIRLEHRVIGLVREHGRVTGVRVQSATGERLIAGRYGVLLACGGFDYDQALKEELLPGPLMRPQGPPVSLGDNIRLARQVDARLAATDEAWYLPGYVPPGAPHYEGHEIAVPLIAERVAPHTIWVNRKGARFVNESSQNAANSFYLRDSQGALANLPCFTILDQQYRERYRLFRTIGAEQAEPANVVRGASLEQLAARLGIDPEGLAATVTRFNDMVRQGHDAQFGRGAGAYERYLGDPRAPHPNLGTIAKPPFYGFEVVTSGVGTKGGALTDEHARVLAQAGGSIDGLYAAGNASAAFNGPKTVAAGCTIPPALVMARQAALHAMGQKS